MNQGPVAEEGRHVAADNSHCQYSHQHRRRCCRPGMDQPEQTDMQCCRQAPSLVWPVAALDNVEDDEGAAGGDCQLMPACQPGMGDSPDKAAKEDACCPNVTTAQNQVYYLVPARALLSFTSAVVSSFHLLRQAFQPDITALITAAAYRGILIELPGCGPGRRNRPGHPLFLPHHGGLPPRWQKGFRWHLWDCRGD